jgi:signal transduction histidine kinase
VEKALLERLSRPYHWAVRALTRGLPPVPSIRGRVLGTRVAALFMLIGAVLIFITVLMPPAAEGSDLLILGYGLAMAVIGTVLLVRQRVSEPVLGLVAAAGTAVITLATLEAGMGTGAEDNQVLYLWVSVFAFWFFGLRHALFQLALIGVADAILLIDQSPSFADGATRWVVTIATFLVTGLLGAWLRRSLEREREESARLAVVAERMRIARDLHDAAGHGVTAISLQSTVGLRALDEDDLEGTRETLEEIKRASRVALEDMRKLLGLLRPSDAPYPELDRVSLSHLDELISECRRAGLRVEVETIGGPVNLPPVLDQAAYRITQEALTNALKHAGAGATATVRVRYDPSSVELEVVDDGHGSSGGVATGSSKGLIGMRERTDLFGGWFDAGPVEGGGFRVFARLPFPNALPRRGSSGNGEAL